MLRNVNPKKPGVRGGIMTTLIWSLAILSAIKLGMSNLHVVYHLHNTLIIKIGGMFIKLYEKFAL